MNIQGHGSPQLRHGIGIFQLECLVFLLSKSECQTLDREYTTYDKISFNIDERSRSFDRKVFYSIRETQIYLSL